MVEYVVSEYTGTNRNGSGGIGDVNPRKYTDPQRAAQDIARHLDRSSEIYEQNKTALPGEKRGITNIEMHAIDSNGARRALTDAETATVRNAIKTVREGAETGIKAAATGMAEQGRRFGVAGKVAGAAAAATLAMAGGANASEIGKDSINAVAPGLGTLALGEGPKKGVLCDAFGQATGALGGVLAGLGVGGLTSWSGPGAAVAGVAAGIGTEAVVTPAATAGCNFVAKKFGL